jgi:DNA-binding HxlR family transcriptional regulator
MLATTLRSVRFPDGGNGMAAGLNRRFYCGVELTLEILQGKWKPVILAHLKEGPMRYGELRAAIPRLSEKMLSERLRDLEEQGLVSRFKVGRRGSPATYRLTQRGESLRPLLGALNDWGFQIADTVGATVEYVGLPTLRAQQSSG